MMRSPVCCVLVVLIASLSSASIDAAQRLTSLTDPTVKYREPAEHYVRLQRGDVTAIIVDNAAIDIAELPGHRAGYNGVASLTHSRQPRNLFVPAVAGLNFEHIHDGTKAGLVEKFEPRAFPMQLRIVDEFTVELHQPPTGNWKLESCGRYRLLESGVIEYSFECIPRAVAYKHDYIGLFWASYIQQPQDKSIWFLGRRAGSADQPVWINGITPKHGVDSTHRPFSGAALLPVDSDFPLTLVNHPSPYESTHAWYYGVSHGMAFVQMFRPEDNIWLAQSPSGGGDGNPAWDFQWFIDKPVVGRSYGFRMHAAYVPFESQAQINSLAERLRP